MKKIAVLVSVIALLLDHAAYSQSMTAEEKAYLDSLANDHQKLESEYLQFRKAKPFLMAYMFVIFVQQRCSRAPRNAELQKLSNFEQESTTAEGRRR